MNSNKTYWSVMGNESTQKRQHIDILREKHRNEIIRMINQYNKDGLREIITIIRNVASDIDVENKKERKINE